MEGPGRILRDPFADLGNLQELFFSLSVGFLFRHVACQLGVPIGELDNSVADHDHGPEERLLFDLLFRVQGVEGRQFFFRFLLDPLHASLEDLLVIVVPGQAGTGRGRRGDDEVPLHDAAGVLGQGVQEGCVVLPPLPVGPQHAVDDPHVLLGQEQGVARFGGTDLLRKEHLLQFREKDRVPTRRARTAHDEFVLIDVDRNVLEDVGHRLAPPEHQGLPFGLLERFGEEPGPFHVDPDRLVPEALKHSMNPGPLLLRLFADQPDAQSLPDSLFLRRQHFRNFRYRLCHDDPPVIYWSLLVLKCLRTHMFTRRLPLPATSPAARPPSRRTRDRVEGTYPDARPGSRRTRSRNTREGASCP